MGFFCRWDAARRPDVEIGRDSYLTFLVEKLEFPCTIFEGLLNGCFMGNFRLFMLILAVAAVSCAKRGNGNSENSGPLPPATQTGANVLGCYLDKTPYIIENNQNTFDFAAGLGNDTFFIAGCPAPYATYWRSLHYLEIEMYHGLQVGVAYAATDNNHIRAEYEVDSTCLYDGYDGPDVTACAGTVTLTKFDQVKRIMSGVFDVKFAIPGCDTVELSDGRFDFKY